MAKKSQDLDTDTAKEKCEELNELLEDAENTFKDYVCGTQKYLEKNLKERPLKTLGIAALIGFSIAQFWRKK